MKYFDNLSAVENEVIRLNSLRSLLTVIANAIDTSNQEDIESVIWQAKELADSINENLGEEFQNLFDVIREDTIDFEEEDEVDLETIYDAKPLQDVINSWIRNK